MLWYSCQICLTNFKKQTAFFFAVACPFIQNYPPVVFKRQYRFKWHFEYFPATKGSINTESDLHLKPGLILCPTKCFLFTQKSENGCSPQKQGKIKKATNHSTKLKSKEILQVRMYDFGHICHLMIDIDRCRVSCYWYFILEYPSAH